MSRLIDIPTRDPRADPQPLSQHARLITLETAQGSQLPDSLVVETLAYVDNGYTRLEKLTLDNLRDKGQFEVVKLASSADIVSLLNRDRDTYKLLDVAFFSHGVVGKIALNFWKGQTLI